MLLASHRLRRLSRSARTAASVAVTALLAVSVGGSLAVSSSACQCAALCGSSTHVVVHDPMNALKSGPAVFEVCSGAQCATFGFDGSQCPDPGGADGKDCSVTSQGLEFWLGLAEEDEDQVSITVNVSAASAMTGDPFIFQGKADVEPTDLDTCGTTCYEATAEFTIPP